MAQNINFKVFFAYLFIYFTACSAGIGVLNTARKTMARMLGNNEHAFDSAQRQFWVVDAEVSSHTSKFCFQLCYKVTSGCTICDMEFL